MVSVRSVSLDEKLLELDTSLSADDICSFDRVFRKLSHSPYKTITLDLSKLQQISPYVLEKILRLEQHLSAEGKHLQVKGCRPDVYKAFRAVKADKFIRILP